jgi:hypothetical protein
MSMILEKSFRTRGTLFKIYKVEDILLGKEDDFLNFNNKTWNSP